MYQRHNLIGFVAGILVSAVIMVVLTALKRKNKLSIPPWILSLIPWLITLQVVLLFCVGSYDKWRMRAELRNVAPAEIRELTVSQGAIQRTISDPAAINKLLPLIQSLGSVMAHHSHPTRIFNVSFRFRDQSYHYRLGQDSQRPEEYWVFRMNSTKSEEEPEIGRVRSSELNRLLEEYMR